jgi:hypothetical protein
LIRTGLVALALAKLFVAFQVLRHEWGFYEVMLTYGAEAVLLGVYNVLRMLVVGVAGALALSHGISFVRNAGRAPA